MSKTLVLLTICLLFPFAHGQKKKKTIINTVSVKQIKFLKKVDKKYQKRHGIHVDLEKTLILEALGTKKESNGEAWFNKGKMRLEIKKPIPSKVIADGTYLWVENPPPKEFKGAKTQVLKAKLDSQRARSQGLIQLLTQGGLLKYFKVVGVQNVGPRVHYFLQPEKQSVEFKRAQVTINIKSEIISELRYWDNLDNETFYKFSKTRFNQSLKKSLFRYTPPKDAEVMAY